MDKLNPRERELYALMMGPLSLKDIAFQMGLSHHTVTVYACRLYRKLGTTERVPVMAAEIARLRGDLEALASVSLPNG